MAFPKIGNIAPAFTLLDQDGEKVSLSSFAVIVTWCCIFTLRP